MKKQIILLLITYSTICRVHAQTYTPINNYGQKHQRIIVDKNFKVPFSSTRTRYTNDASPGDLQLYQGTTDTFLMVYQGTRWERLIDSSLTQHYLFNKIIPISASTFNLSILYTDYIFTGTSNTTWTLPTISGYKNIRFYIKNRGTADIIINSNTGGNEIYDTGIINTITINPNKSCMITNDGVYWLVSFLNYIPAATITSNALVSSASTLTLSSAHTDYIFSGTTTTWRFPPISGNTNVRINIKNRGSGNITIISSAGANDFYGTGALNTTDLLPGTAYTFFNDGTYWNIQ